MFRIKEVSKFLLSPDLQYKCTEAVASLPVQQFLNWTKQCECAMSLKFRVFENLLHVWNLYIINVCVRYSLLQDVFAMGTAYLGGRVAIKNIICVLLKNFEIGFFFIFKFKFYCK
jgi:hypothetical protein